MHDRKIQEYSILNRNGNRLTMNVKQISQDNVCALTWPIIVNDLTFCNRKGPLCQI